MESDLETHVLPAFRADVIAALEASFVRVVGQELPREVTPRTSVYVQEFDPGSGISAGHVDLHWWRYTAIPIICDRWGAALSDQAALERIVESERATAAGDTVTLDEMSKLMEERRRTDDGDPHGVAASEERTDIEGDRPE